MHDKDKDAGSPTNKGASPAQIFSALWRRLSRRRLDPQPLQPAGRRSGRGSDSLEPYLKHGRDSAPGPLE